MNSSGLKMGSIYCTELVATLAFTLALLALTSSEAVGQTTSATSLELGRRLLQVENVSEPLKQSDDTIRVDPLDSLKKYRGGYNLTNKHYWSVMLSLSLSSSNISQALIKNLFVPFSVNHIYGNLWICIWGALASGWASGWSVSAGHHHLL